MKTSHIIILILATVALVLTIAPAAAGQKSEPGVAVPKLPRYGAATCPNCALMQFVPSECCSEAAPCQQIQLDDARETVNSLYRTGTQEELEEAVGRLLTATIKRLKAQQAQSGDLNNVETSPRELAA